MKQLVLSTFTGAGLLDRGFQPPRFYVVSLGDYLMGHNIKDKHAMPGVFDGVIGGPSCQWASKAKGGVESPHDNMIPEFLRIVEEAQPRWAMMENVDVPQTREFMDIHAPDWDSVSLRDWDCGGHTNRIRRFWFKGLLPPPVPLKREGTPSWSVLATSWTERDHREGLHSKLGYNSAAYLQGYPLLGEDIVNALPDAIAQRSKENFAVHMLGNGVPRAMAEYLANWIYENT